MGRYVDDTSRIIAELDYSKTTDLGAKTGGFNLLNIPDSAASIDADVFLSTWNKPFLDRARERNDRIAVATVVREAKFYHDTSSMPKVGTDFTGFGREIHYLENWGYRYDPVSSTMMRSLDPAMYPRLTERLPNRLD